VKIPIQNLYYVLCFAWKYVPQDLTINVGAIPASSDVLDLCAYVLVGGMDYLFRRGLHHGYLGRDEQTARLRGRILITKSVRCRTRARPEAVCEFDEFSPNVLPNQIIRTTTGILAKSLGLNSGLKDRLRTTYGSLAGIDEVRVTDELFRRIQIYRSNSYYAFLLHVCRLVSSLRLPDPGGGGGRFRDLLSDENVMEKVFEEFLRNFYRLKQREFPHIESAQLQWNAKSARDPDLALLPQMRTDIRLRNQARTIIIDAKYYKDALQEHYGVKKAHSENLYQLLAYLRAENAANPRVRPEGILVYPAGDNAVDASFHIDGYSVRLYTLNLNQTWQLIERDLKGLLDL
jgi:5-methylcytosine-specific restriction enzyme subunit McrC